MPFGTLSYNGYVFGDYTITKAEGSPVYDDSGMTIVRMRWVFTASSVITADAGDANAGDHFARVRQQLEISGQRFEIADKGFGPALVVNASGGIIRDVDFGPRPQILSWVPIGHTQSVEFVWSIEVNLPPECAVNLTGISAFNYSTSWAISPAGFTVRTITGYLEIALTRDDDGVSIPDNADNYRELIAVNLPVNYSRSQTYDLSPNGKRLSFNIVDTEIPSSNPYPAGVTSIEASHRVRSTGYRPDAKNTISVSIELQQTAKRSDAWEIFRTIVATRVAVPKAAGLTVMIKNLELVEPLFGTKFDFQVDYTVIASEDALDNIINDLGLYESLGYDWTAWATSMAGIDGARGMAGMNQDNQWKKIVDQCNQELPFIGSSEIEPQYPPDTSLTVLTNEIPPPDKSYVKWNAQIVEDTEYNKVFARELGEVTDFLNNPSPNDPFATIAGIGGLPSLESTVAQSAPAMYWRWVGSAQRLGFPIPVPDLQTIDGVQVEKVGQNRLTQRNLGDYFGVDLFQTDWDQYYRVTERPTEILESDFSVDPNQ